MREPIRIEPMTEADLAEVMAIEETSFSLPWTEEDFRAMLALPRNVVLIARTGEGVLCGYVCYMSVMEIGDIMNVAVHPDYRRQSIGRQLMQTAHRDASGHGVETMMLEVRESNLPARRLYAELGYEEISVRKNYYRKPLENAVIMRIFLG